MSVEAWLRGPVEDVSPLLMPVAHSILQAKEDLRKAASGLTNGELRQRPGGAASIAFHLRHIAGSADRLLTYALDQPLTPEQLTALTAEKDEDAGDVSATGLLAAVDRSLDHVLDQVSRTREDQLTAQRHVGRARLPSSMLGLLFHIAEHTQRHTGQVITTAMIVRASS